MINKIYENNNKILQENIDFIQEKKYNKICMKL